MHLARACAQASGCFTVSYRPVGRSAADLDLFAALVAALSAWPDGKDRQHDQRIGELRRHCGTVLEVNGGWLKAPLAEARWFASTFYGTEIQRPRFAQRKVARLEINREHP